MALCDATFPTDGRWAAAVSGGADSVAMLLLGVQAGVVGHVLTVDHETRAGASAHDAAFVAELAERLHLPVTVVRRSHIEPRLGPRRGGASAWFRRVRLLAYRDVVRRHDLSGVLLAHHANDQAETVLLRLLRGGANVGGMATSARVGGVRIWRPLLGVTKPDLTALLLSRGQPWREDTTNASPAYGRNRVRAVLATRPGLTDALLALAAAARDYRTAVRRAGAAAVRDPVRVGDFATLPRPVAREAARALLTRSIPPDSVTDAVADRFLAWASDAANPARLSLPGPTTAYRRRGVVTIEQGPG